MSNTIGTTEGSGRRARTGKLGSGGEFSQYIAATTGPYQVLGYETLTVATSALTLGGTLSGNVPPAGATHALISVEPTATGSDTDGVTDGVRVRQDNTAPTSSVGIFVPGGSVMEVCPITISGGEDVPALGRVKLIAGQATSMKVTVEYRTYAAA